MQPNVSPVDEQLKAIDQVSRATVFGDQPENFGNGFSLKKTVLAHGREMDTYGPAYFELDLRVHSPLPDSDKGYRTNRILELSGLDSFS